MSCFAVCVRLSPGNLSIADFHVFSAEADEVAMMMQW